MTRKARNRNWIRWIGALGTGTALATTAASAAEPVVSAGSGPVPVSGPTPKIRFAALTNDLGKITGGEVVKCEFVFTNAGDGLLIVTNVLPSCGCTPAGKWTREVAPGKTGVIPIQLDSTSLDGNVIKTVGVSCNDPQQPRTILQIRALVWWPIKVVPKSAFLNIKAEATSNALSVIRIHSNLEEPLVLSAPESTHPCFAAELKTVQAGKEFQLIIQAVPPFETNQMKGQVKLATSARQAPAITIPVFALVQPVVTVMPAMLALPGGPLVDPATYMVSIRNNGTNALGVSEPVLNAKGVEVSLREVQPGRFFTVTLKFPAGFELSHEEKTELSLKSNHPRYPRITVPLTRWSAMAKPK